MRSRSSTPTSPIIAALLATTAVSVAAPAMAGELPTGGSVAYGQIGIATPNARTMQIRQGTKSAIVNWQSFSIGSGSRVEVKQPSSSAVLLNRVQGSTPSTIAGSLDANGQVYLVNPNGIAITPSGIVRTKGFVASTLDTTDADFIAGRRRFTGNGSSAAVVNQGSIEIGKGGYAALLGGSVDNAGTVSVPMGKVGLGAGEAATLDLSGDGFLQVAVPSNGSGDAPLISNAGTVRAEGGRIEMKAATARTIARNAINLSGTAEARTVGGRSGAIVLGGGEGGAVTVTGRLAASAAKARTARKGQGGTIEVTGKAIKLAGAALDASGVDGGGTIRIGGDLKGGGPLPHADTTSVDAATTIRADAGERGDGGSIVLWSDDYTRYAGSLSARGGTTSGDGGSAEVSGKKLLSFTGTADLSAKHGAFGTLLLDPYNVIICDGCAGSFSGSISGSASVEFAPTADSAIERTAIQLVLQSASVVISNGDAASNSGSAGSIILAAFAPSGADSPLVWATPNSSLSLNSVGPIDIRSSINGAGDVFLTADPGGNSGSVASNIAISANILARNIDIFGSGDIDISSRVAVLDAGSNLRIQAGNNLRLSPPLGPGAGCSLCGGSIAILGSSLTNVAGPAAIVPGQGQNFTVGLFGPIGDSDLGTLIANHRYGSRYFPEGFDPGTINPIAGESSNNYVVFNDQPTVTYSTNASRRYGSATLVDLVPFVSGLVNADSGTPGLPLDSTALGDAAGQRPGALTPTLGTSLSSIEYLVAIGYLAVPVAGTLDITPAPLSITARNQVKLFGTTFVFGADDFTALGLANGDGVASATLGSVGALANANFLGSPYVITVSNAVAASGTDLANYAVTYNSGSFFVVDPRSAQDETDPARLPSVPVVFNNPPDVIIDGLDGGGNGGGGAGGGDLIKNAQTALGFIETSANTLEQEVAACEHKYGSGQGARGGYVACVGGALDSLAADLDKRILTLPEPFKGIAAAIHEAARDVRSARTIGEARAAVRKAIATVHKAIALLRADDKDVSELQIRQGQSIERALKVVDISLNRATGI